MKRIGPSTEPWGTPQVLGLAFQRAMYSDHIVLCRCVRDALPYSSESHEGSVVRVIVCFCYCLLLSAFYNEFERLVLCCS